GRICRSRPGHHTPERSGCPSAAFGAGPAGFDGAAGAPPVWAVTGLAQKATPRAAIVSRRAREDRISNLLLARHQRIADGERASIGENELAHRAGVCGRVARVPALDRHLVADLHETRLESASNEAGRRAGLERPLLGLAAFGHVEEEPGMRILETNLRERALDRNRLIGVEHGGEGMVSLDPQPDRGYE